MIPLEYKIILTSVVLLAIVTAITYGNDCILEKYPKLVPVIDSWLFCTLSGAAYFFILELWRL